MMCLDCGNGLTLLSARCPRCGKKYIGKAIAVILAFVVGLPLVLVGIGFLITFLMSTAARGGF
jgi:hypothetical protein